MIGRPRVVCERKAEKAPSLRGEAILCVSLESERRRCITPLLFACAPQPLIPGVTGWVMGGGGPGDLRLQGRRD